MRLLQEVVAVKQFVGIGAFSVGNFPQKSRQGVRFPRLKKLLNPLGGFPPLRLHTQEGSVRLGVRVA